MLRAARHAGRRREARSGEPMWSPGGCLGMACQLTTLPSPAGKKVVEAPAALAALAALALVAAAPTRAARAATTPYPRLPPRAVMLRTELYSCRLLRLLNVHITHLRERNGWGRGGPCRNGRSTRSRTRVSSRGIRGAQ